MSFSHLGLVYIWLVKIVTSFLDKKYKDKAENPRNVQNIETLLVVVEY